MDGRPPIGVDREPMPDEGGDVEAAATVSADPMLTTREVAELLGVDVQTIRAWTKRDDDPIPVVRLPDGRMRFRRSALEAWIDGRRVGPKVEP